MSRTRTTSFAVRFLIALLLAAPLAAQAHVELPLIFGNGAVLQRDKPIRVWGWSGPHARVQVQFDHSKADVTADAKGRWHAVFPAHAAGGPFQLSVRSGKDEIVSHDLLVGDVYLASGQSNMEFELYKARNAAAEIAHATDGAIRQIKIPDSWSIQPSDHLSASHWVAASPDTAAQFSAVAYFFAREIRADQHVPIGIINDNWGGSRIEPWMDAQTAGVKPDAIKARVERDDAAEAKAIAATRQHLVQRWPGVIGANPADAEQARYAATNLDQRGWQPINVPGYWESQGYYGMDGVAWYRTTFELNAADAAAGVTLGLGMIDDSDHAWLDDRLIGTTDNGWDKPRLYRVAPGALKAGRHTLAIRVDDLGAGGGIHGDAALLYIQPDHAARRAFPGPWRFRPEAVTLVPANNNNQIATLLYNQMIHPLLPLAIRGVIWYQGEANATEQDAFKYRDQFAALIRQWRRDFRQPALPFLWVQLANFKSGVDTTTSSPWAMLRESQSTALALPHTAQAVTIDVGNPDNIHPTDKQTVGHRLALAARHVVYGESLLYSGPVYRAMTIEGHAIRLHFASPGSALKTRGDVLAGFTIATSDRHFHAATARIDGDDVVVRSADVSRPVAVRYGWSENPAAANLVNAAGLPASPFRTDHW
ncbi:9-O-acetylesterase [Rhodanobacter sp. B05]|uniref:sialate O-acetylesterase n=1 Tax=Rhodanobacter sp. B05 TaxID=1945859 RepID=UPI0009871CE9|nr:sialate O-acetylesterase [Rhodanobacter sp. B05]OOG58510.1 9-O-acetylesterase [Rhodanobacter sp. B05]